MFGANEVRKYNADPNSLQVHKIWYTIQGEGPYSGQPAIFCRLTGCILKCFFCDTVWDDANDSHYSIKDLFSALDQQSALHKCRLFVFTGGEPLRQNLTKLFWLMLEAYGKNVQIQIETSGGVWPREMDEVLRHPQVTIVCSPKTPKIQQEMFDHADVFKYVIKAGYSDPTDGLPTFKTQAGLQKTHFEVASNGQTAFSREYKVARPRPGAPVYVMPCDEYDPKKNDANTAEVAKIALKYGYVAQLQAHKYFKVD